MDIAHELQVAFEADVLQADVEQRLKKRLSYPMSSGKHS